MATATEVLGSQSQQESALDAGIDQLSQEQEIQFQSFKKIVLSSDGTVFWVATNQKMTAMGSLHYATDRSQDEDQTIGHNQMIFTSKTEVSVFNSLAPMTMWIGTWRISGAAPLLVAFAQRGPYYKEADVFHYSGFAVYPAMRSQIIYSAKDLPIGPIVSNSLPIWLTPNDFAPVYPSFLVPDNIVPPYIVCHIEPGATESLAAAPLLGPWPGVTQPNTGASPLHSLPVSVQARDTVTLTLYGFSNATAWQYLMSLYEASLSPGYFGFANSPVPIDEKRVQVEIAALAQKKTITIIANYLQGTADALARRLILSASVSEIYIGGGVSLFGYGEIFQDEQIMYATAMVTE